MPPLPAALEAPIPPPVSGSPVPTLAPSTSPPSPLTVLNVAGSTPTPVPVNPCCKHAPTRIANDRFEGSVFLKLRPQPSPSPAASPDCSCCSDFFSAHPAIQFELSIQGRFTRETQHPLFIGAELTAPSPFTLQLSWLKRSLIKLVAGVISSFIPNVKWTLGNAAVGEFPLLAFPLVKSMDRIVVSAADGSGSAAPPPSEAVCPIGIEPAPQLGWQQFPVSAFSRSLCPMSMRFHPSFLYSFCFFSHNLDLLRWKAVDMPARLPDIDLHSIWADHPLRLVCYELIDTAGSHAQSNRVTYFALELQHSRGQQDASSRSLKQREEEEERGEGEERRAGPVIDRLPYNLCCCIITECRCCASQLRSSQGGTRSPPAAPLCPSRSGHQLRSESSWTETQRTTAASPSDRHRAALPEAERGTQSDVRGLDSSGAAARCDERQSDVEGELKRSGVRSLGVVQLQQRHSRQAASAPTRRCCYGVQHGSSVWLTARMTAVPLYSFILLAIFSATLDTSLRSYASNAT